MPAECLVEQMVLPIAKPTPVTGMGFVIYTYTPFRGLGGTYTPFRGLGGY